MKPKYIIVFLLLLIGSNLISLLFSWKSHLEKETALIKPVIQVFELEGKGEKWDIENYLVFKTSQSARRGSINLIYKDGTKVENKISYLKVEVTEDNELIKVLLNPGKLEPINNIFNSINLSSIDKEINKEMLDKKDVTITWKDNLGKSYKESINLKVIKEI